jgi:Outer membrane efflux protein
MLSRTIISLLFILDNCAFAQYNLQYFVDKALDNSPVAKDYANLYSINSLQAELDKSQNSAFQVYLTSNLLFSPYFNNNGVLLTPNPGSKAIGYDPAITNGALYSAQINVEKNILNSGLLDALNEQRSVQGKSYDNKSVGGKHDLEKQVTDQYLSALQHLLSYNLSKRIENNLHNQLTLTGDLVEKGYVKVSDYLQLEIEIKTQSIAMDQTWQNYRSGLSQLYSLCGIQDTQTVAIDTVELKMTGTKSPSRFLTQFHLDSLSAAAQQQVFEARYLPQVNLFFNAGLNAVELVDVQRRLGMSAGINLSLLILDGGQRSITRQQTYLSERTLSNYEDYLAGGISARRRDSENRIASLRKNLADMKAQLTDYEKLLDLSESQLRQGNLSMVEYLTLVRNYVDLQKTFIATQINYQLEISNYNYWNW